MKRWCKRYDGTWQSLKERSHRPRHHPRQYTAEEEAIIRQALDQSFFRYGWEGASKDAGYTRSYSGFIYAARRMGLCGGKANPKPPRKRDRRYPELSVLGEKVQIDVKELNEKLKSHLAWSNYKPMRTLDDKSPLEILRKKLATA